MTVSTKFEEKYRFSTDPWQALDSSRADYYRWLIEAATRWNKSNSPRLLDIGCGEGFLTAQIARGIQAREATGVDVAETAVARARQAYPDMIFEVADFGRSIADLGEFDVITCSQVIYYLRPAQLAAFFQNIYSSLADDGVVVIAATCPGGDYFEPEEFQAICAGAFEKLGVSQHGDHQLFVGRKRACDVVVSIDYEMYFSVLTPSLDQWQKQVFEPTDAMLEACDKTGAKLTIFVEMGQYHFLEQHAPAISARMKAQLVGAIQRGHDVQVHLHTRWHPDCGACLGANGSVELANDVLRMHEIPDGKLRPILARAKNDLEALLRPVNDAYRAICFRAGKYQIQPTDRILPALRDAGYACDSSVWYNGYLQSYDGKPGFDFRTLWHPTKPYWVSASNINRQVARDHSVDILEIPIVAAEVQWSLDILDAPALLNMFDKHTAGGRTRVMIGHSYAPKRDRVEQLTLALQELALRGVRFATLQAQAQIQREDPALEAELRALARYSARSRAAPEELWTRIGSQRQKSAQVIMQSLLDSGLASGLLRIADIGCGTGEFLTFPLLYLLQDKADVELQGVDVDAPSIERAQENAASFGMYKTKFRCGGVQALEGEFDAIILSHVLDRVSDPAALLREAAGKLVTGGVIIVISANGGAYSQIERRSVTWAYNTVMRMPMGVRHFVVQIKRMLGRLHRPSASGAVPAPPIGTLNLMSETPSHPLLLSRLHRLLRDASLSPASWRNLAALGGILGSRMDRLAGWNSKPERLPARLASEWIVLTRRSG